MPNKEEKRITEQSSLYEHLEKNERGRTHRSYQC